MAHENLPDLAANLSRLYEEMAGPGLDDDDPRMEHDEGSWDGVPAFTDRDFQLFGEAARIRLEENERAGGGGGLPEGHDSAAGCETLEVYNRRLEEGGVRPAPGAEEL